jgi:hypothetical protein
LRLDWLRKGKGKIHQGKNPDGGQGSATDFFCKQPAMDHPWKPCFMDGRRKARE